MELARLARTPEGLATARMGGMCVLVVALAAGLQVAPAAEVTFPDPVLERLVRLELGIPVPAPITDLNMLNLVDLRTEPAHTLGWGQVADLTGIEHAANLTVFSASGDLIQDASALSGLRKLERLWLSDNPITDLAPLSTLAALTDLHVSGNGLVDISSLSVLTGLEVLCLSDNNVTDISAISGMSKLRWLLVEKNLVSDVSALGGKVELFGLLLSQNQVTDLSPLQSSTKLNWFVAERNCIEDLWPLSSLTALSLIDLEDNSISDISPLAVLTELGELDLRANPLNAAAYETYLPLIQQNNPEAAILYDPIAEPTSLGLFGLGAAAVLLRARRSTVRQQRQC